MDPTPPQTMNNDVTILDTFTSKCEDGNDNRVGYCDDKESPSIIVATQIEGTLLENIKKTIELSKDPTTSIVRMEDDFMWYERKILKIRPTVNDNQNEELIRLASDSVVKRLVCM